jgi:ankyrin repeat protein
MYAAMMGHAAVVELLISARAALDQQDMTGRTALIFSAMAGQQTSASVLLKSGANPQLPDHAGSTAIMVAQRHGRLALCALLGAGTRPHPTPRPRGLRPRR